MASIFTRIMTGEIPGRIVHEDELCVAFLDAFPLTHGHTLVVPRAEVDHWTDLTPEVAAHLTTVAQRIGRASREAFGTQRACLVVAGFEVPHTHLHVIPANGMADLDFSSKLPDTERTDELLDADQQKLLAALR